MSRTGDELRASRAAVRQRLLDRRLSAGTLRGTLANAGWAGRKPLPSSQAAAPFSIGGGGGTGPSFWLEMESHATPKLPDDSVVQLEYLTVGWSPAEPASQPFSMTGEWSHIGTEGVTPPSGLAPSVPGLYFVTATVNLFEALGAGDSIVRLEVSTTTVASWFCPDVSQFVPAALDQWSDFYISVSGIIPVEAGQSIGVTLRNDSLGGSRTWSYVEAYAGAVRVDDWVTPPVA